MKNKKADLKNVAGGGIKDIFSQAASGFKTGVNMLVKSEFGQGLGRKGQQAFDRLVKKLEAGLNKSIDKKLRQAETYVGRTIDSKLG